MDGDLNFLSSIKVQIAALTLTHYVYKTFDVGLLVTMRNTMLDTKMSCIIVT